MVVVGGALHKLLVDGGFGVGFNWKRLYIALTRLPSIFIAEA